MFVRVSFVLSCAVVTAAAYPFLVSSLVAPTAVAGVQPAEGKGPTLEEEIRARLKSMEEALLRGDAAGVSAGYSDDAVIIGPRREEARGREAVDKYWAGLKGAKSWTLEVISVEGSPNVPVQRGRSTLVMERDGRTHTSDMQCLHVWKRDAEGRLRIAVDVYWPTSAGR